MQFTPANREDIAKYYKNSILKFKDTGDTLFHLSHVDVNVVSGTVDDGRDFKLYLSDDEPYEVDYILPHKSFFQYGANAVMLERIPAKQYHRGITSENTRLCHRDSAGPGFITLPLKMDILKSFVQKQKFFSLKEAMAADVVSAVLSPRMMYMKNNRQIHIDFVPVARVNANNTITMIQPVFEEEVKELLKTTQEDTVFTIKQAGVK